MKLNIERLVIAITFLAVFAMAARISIDSDTWWHLRTGEYAIENRSFPITDHFSYTRFGIKYDYPGWFMQIPMTWIYRAFGPGGLNIWTAIMVCLAFLFIWKTTQGNIFIRSFVLILAAATSGVYWAARPYLMTFVLSAVYIWLFETMRKNNYQSVRKQIFWILVLMALWANSHPGFFTGFLIFGVYFADCIIKWMIKESTFQEVKKLFLMGIVMIGCACLNPNGIGILAYPFKTVEIGALQDYIQEWQSPNFHSISVQPFAWSILLMLAAVGFSGRKMLWSDFFLTAGFVYMGLMAGRNIALFGLAAPMVITRHLSPILDNLMLTKWHVNPSIMVTSRQNVLNWGILFILFIAVIVKISMIYPLAANEKAFQKIFPVEAVNYIKQTQPQGRLFNSYNWGGYLLWNLPEYPVFIDGRTDLYNDEVINEWIKVVKGESGWEQTLERWNVGVILIEPGMRLTSMLEDEWLLEYEDDMAQLWVRK